MLRFRLCGVFPPCPPTRLHNMMNRDRVKPAFAERIIMYLDINIIHNKTNEGLEDSRVNRSKVNKTKCINIFTCRVVRVTRITGSSSDDWIY
jgi:hypothetical protein